MSIQLFVTILALIVFLCCAIWTFMRNSDSSILLPLSTKVYLIAFFTMFIVVLRHPVPDYEPEYTSKCIQGYKYLITKSGGITPLIQLGGYVECTNAGKPS